MIHLIHFSISYILRCNFGLLHYITSFCRNIHNFVWKFKDATKISSDLEMSSMNVFFGRYDGMINSAGTVEFEIHKVTWGAFGC